MSDAANNVIMFPKERIANPDTSGPVTSAEDVDERVNAVHQIHIDNVLDAVIDTLAIQLHVGGFEVEDEDGAALSFITETVRSFMSAKHGIYHPFQEVMNQVMEEDDEGYYQIANDIIIATLDNEDEVEQTVEKMPEAVTEDSCAVPS